MSNILEELALSIGLKTSSFEAGAQTIIAGAERINRAFELLGLGIGIGAALEMFDKIISKAEGIQHLSDALGGVATDSLQAFDYAVIQVGGSTDEADKIWTKARDSIDKLGEGVQTEVALFAKLGLTQQDLIGLPLDQALVKIAQAFNESSDKAGAYDAIVTILGGRNAPQLMAVLDDLAHSGLQGFIDKAKEAGQVIDGSTIAEIDKFASRLTLLKGEAVTTGSAILNVIFKVGEMIGTGAAMWVNAFDGIPPQIDNIEPAAKRAAAALGTMTDKTTQTAAQFQKQFEIQQATEALNDLQLDYDAKHAEGGQKITDLWVIYNQKLQDSVNFQGTELEQIKMTTEAEKARIAIRDEESKQRLALFSLQDQTSSLNTQLAKAQEEYAVSKMTSEEKILYYQQQQALLNTAVSQDTARVAADERDIVAAKAAGKDTTQLEISLQYDKQKLLQDELLQIANQKLLDQSISDELRTQLTLLKQQLETKQAVQDVSVKGENYAGFIQGESSAALGGTIQQLENQLNALGRNGTTQIKDANENTDYADFATAQLLKSQLATAQQEQALRQQIQSFDLAHGEDATRAQFGDSDTQRALNDMASQQTQQTQVLQNIDNRLGTILPTG